MKVSEALRDEGLQPYYRKKFHEIAIKAGIADLDLEKDWKLIKRQLQGTSSFNPAALLGSIWGAYRQAPYWPFAVCLNLVLIGACIALKLPVWAMNLNVLGIMYIGFGNSLLFIKYLRARIRLSSMALVHEHMQPNPWLGFLAGLLAIGVLSAAIIVDLRRQLDLQDQAAVIKAPSSDTGAAPTLVDALTEIIPSDSAPSSPTTQAHSIEAINGILFLRENGKLIQLTGDGGNEQAVVSPDGKLIAYIHVQEPIENEEGWTELRLYKMFPEGSEGNELRIPGPRDSEGQFINTASPSFSPDQKSIFAVVQTGVVSGEVYRFTLADSTWHGPLIDSNSVEILQSGAFKGYMLVDRHKYIDGGGSYEEFDLASPAGKTVYAIPGTRSDQVDEAARLNAIAQWKAKTS